MSYRLEARYLGSDWDSKMVNQDIHPTTEAAQQKIEEEKAFDAHNKIDGFEYRVVPLVPTAEYKVVENLRAELAKLKEEIAAYQETLDTGHYPEGSESEYYTRKKMEEAEGREWRLLKLFKGTGLEA